MRLGGWGEGLSLTKSSGNSTNKFPEALWRHLSQRAAFHLSLSEHWLYIQLTLTMRSLKRTADVSCIACGGTRRPDGTSPEATAAQFMQLKL